MSADIYWTAAPPGNYTFAPTTNPDTIEPDWLAPVWDDPFHGQDDPFQTGGDPFQARGEPFPNGSHPYVVHRRPAYGVKRHEGMSSVVIVLLTFYAIPVVALVGIVGNAANLFTLASPQLRSVSYVYLKALAIADLLCMVFVMLCIGSEKIKDLNWPVSRQYWFAFYQAHLMLAIVNWAISAGVLLVVVLTVERFVCCVFPVRFHRWHSSRRHAVCAVLGCYALSTVLYLPYALGRHRVHVERDGATLLRYQMADSVIFQRRWWQVYEWTREVLVRFGPSVLLAVLNTGIMVSVLKRRRVRQRSISRVAEALRHTQRRPPVVLLTPAQTSPARTPSAHMQPPGVNRNGYKLSASLNVESEVTSACSSSRKETPNIRRKGAVRHVPGGGHLQSRHSRDESLLLLLLCIVVMYFVCNLPAAVNLLFISDTMKKRPDYQVFRACANLLETLNHATNFYVFCLCSADYRAALLNKFPCLRHVTARRAAVASLLMRSIEFWQMQRSAQPPSNNNNNAASSAQSSRRRGGGSGGVSSRLRSPTSLCAASPLLRQSHTPSGTTQLLDIPSSAEPSSYRLSQSPQSSCVSPVSPTQYRRRLDDGGGVTSADAASFDDVTCEATSDGDRRYLRLERQWQPTVTIELEPSTSVVVY